MRSSAVIDAEQVRIRARQRQVMQLRCQELMTFMQIAEKVGVSEGQAGRDFKAALRDCIPPEDRATAVAAELEKLSYYEQAALTVMRRVHHVCSHGRMVLDQDGNPIEDDAPILAAIGKLLSIQAARRAILGLDAPPRRIIEVIPAEVVDNEIQRLAAELGVSDDELAGLYADSTAELAQLQEASELRALASG